ncbi:MAG: ABC transporter permease [Deltaproteobacteria bacterium]|nr:ABC transporter permease [Deltaproteobacteria bacterium]
MGTYILKRLYHSVIVLFGITLFVFLLLQCAGDPVRLLLPFDATQQEYEDLREELGFNAPIHVQYWNFLKRAVKLDFGMSLRNHVPVFDLIKDYFKNTLLLATTAFIIALAVAVPGGILSAIRRNSILDFVISIFVVIGQAMPLYWLGLMLVLVFAVALGWFPSGGFGYGKPLVLPAITLGVFSTSRIARMARSSMLEVLGQDYIRTARSQGIKETTVTFKYALKAAAIPIVTLIGTEYCILLEGTVVTETIFSWPGVGRLVVQACYARDYPVVQAIVIVITGIIVFLNLAVDVLYTYLDPRIKYGKVEE